MCGLVNEEMGFRTIKILMSLSAFGSILKNVLEPMSAGVKVILLGGHDTTGEYLHPYTELGAPKVYVYMYTIDASTKRWAFTLPKFDEPFGSRFYFERFLRTDVGWCEGRTLGWT